MITNFTNPDICFCILAIVPLLMALSTHISNLIPLEKWPGTQWWYFQILKMMSSGDMTS